MTVLRLGMPAILSRSPPMVLSTPFKVFLSGTTTRELLAWLDNDRISVLLSLYFVLKASRLLDIRTNKHTHTLKSPSTTEPPDILLLLLDYNLDNH